MGNPNGRYIHGHKRKGKASPEYKTWLGIKSRCSREKHKDYPNWGGRGIRVCPEWDASFEQFLADMGARPSPRHQIDRKDPDGNYCPSNCRWVTPTTQGAENRRNIQPVTVNGIVFKSIAEACRHFGVNKTAVSYRINAGIPIEQAFTPRRLRSRRTRESYLPKDHPDRRP